MFFRRRWFVVFAFSFIFLSSEIAHSQPQATLQAEQWFKSVDKKMEQAYHDVLNVIQHSPLPVETKKVLKKDFIEAQKSWLKYREREAAARAGFTAQGGSAYSMDYLANLAELTEERTKIFLRFIDQVK